MILADLQPQHGQLKLGRAELDQFGFDEDTLVRLFGEAGVLAISEIPPTVDCGPDHLSLEGKATVPGLFTNPVAVSLKVKTEGTGFRTLVHLTCPKGWQFEHSFPDLPINLPERPNHLCGLNLQGMVFILSSYTCSEEKLERGLNFSAAWLPVGMLGLIDTLMKAAKVPSPGDDSIPLYGTVTFVAGEAPAADDEAWPWDRKGPVQGISLYAELGYGKLDGLPNGLTWETPLGVRIFSPLDEDPSDKEVSIPLMVLVTEFKGRLGRLELGGEVPAGEADTLLLQGVLNLDKPAELVDAVGTLTGDSSFAVHLPANVFLAGLCQIGISLHLAFADGGVTVAAAGLRIEYDMDEEQNWLKEIGLEMISFKVRQLRLLLIEPFDKERRDYFGTLDATASLDSLKLDVTASIPDMSLLAVQRDPVTLQVSGLLKALQLHLSQPPALTIKGLSLSVTAGTAYVFTIELSEDETARESFALPDLRLSLFNSGWLFEAGGPDAPLIPVSSLVERLSKDVDALSNLKMPGALASLEIGRARIAYQSDSASLDTSFSLELTGSITLGGEDSHPQPRLVARVLIDCATLEGEPHHIFGGELTLMAGDGTPRVFELQVDSSATGTVLLASYQNGSLHLDDLLELFKSNGSVPSAPAALAGVTIDAATIKICPGGNFTVTCSGNLPVNESQLAISLKLKALKVDGNYTIEFSGSVVVAEQSFTLGLSQAHEESRLVAVYAPNQPQALRVSNVLAAISSSLADELFPDPKHHDFEVHVASAVLALAVEDGSKRALVALDVGRIDLAELPLVGGALSGAATIESLRVVAATAAPKPAEAVGDGGQTPGDSGDVVAWNALLQLRSSGAAPLPAEGISEGVVVAAVVKTETTETPLALPAAGSPPAPSPSPGGTTVGASPAPAGQEDGTKWVQVERSFGPVHLARVGARLDSGRLWFVLDASLTLGGLSVELMGLGIGCELSRFELTPGLQGMGLSYSQDPVEIAGAFLAVSEPSGNTRYDGAAVVHAETFTLGAVGSYATVNGVPSLFIFAELDAVLGGPPAFFVTGLMGGFGYNRSLRIPAQDEVASFPLVRGLLDEAGPAEEVAHPGGGGLAGMLAQLMDGSGGPPWLSEAEGESWLAVGVTFTSFSAMETRALLIAEFGHELQFALLGLSTLRLPHDSPETFAYLELEIEARLRPREGSFALTALLSQNSFVFDPACRLSGGFALCIWFAEDRAGDFVLTLGGYHPAYSPPAWYPHEPRVALHWPVSDLVTIDGSAYFALTPSCVMAGGSLQVLFHDGNLRAWLTAQADFLMGWAPFHFTGEAAVSVGVSYVLDLGVIHKTLSVELGAHLSLWGPPTAGEAHVSFYIVSFAIKFGPDPLPPRPERSWTQDLKPLLPESPCTIQILAGLLSGPSQQPDGKDVPIRVRPDSLVIATNSTIPASSVVAVHDKDQAPISVKVADAPRAPAIRPLGLSSVDSQHKVIIRNNQNQAIDLKEAGWSFTPQTRHLPAALWGEPVDPGARPDPCGDLVKDQLVGLTLTAPGPHAGPSTGAGQLGEPSQAAQGSLPEAGLLPAAGQVIADRSAIAAALTSDQSSVRNDLRSVLVELGFKLTPINLPPGPVTGSGPLPTLIMLAPTP